MTTRSTFPDYSARLRDFICRSSLEASRSEEMERQFNLLALELFALQYAHNQPFRSFCELRGVSVDAITSWEDVPAVPAAAFKERELTSLPIAQRIRVFQSSGTTVGKRSRHFHNDESLAVYEASLLAWCKPNVFPKDDCLPLLFLTPPSSSAPDSSLVHMFETIRRQFGTAGSQFVGSLNATGAWELDMSKGLPALDDFTRANQPVALLGTAFNFVHLLDALTAKNFTFKLPHGSRVMETGGYKNRSRELPKTQLHDSITRGLGIPTDHIVAEYGMSELSSQAYDSTVGGVQPRTTTGRRVFQFPAWAKAQLVSPETGREVEDGQTGLIRVFDLANVSSVVAVQTEDLAVRRGEGFELIGRAALAEPRGCSLLSP